MLRFTQYQPWLPILTPNSLMAKESEDIKQRAPGQLGFLAPQNRSCPHPVTETCFREWSVGTPPEEFGHCSVQHRQKQCPAPFPKGCWDLGMGLRTQAKELMGLLEAHTVVLAKAKLAGSTPTLREVEVDLRRREAGGRQLSSTTQETQNPHFSPLRNLGLSHPL